MCLLELENKQYDESFTKIGHEGGKLSLKHAAAK
jgi:hypothetical protein